MNRDAGHGSPGARPGGEATAAATALRGERIAVLAEAVREASRRERLASRRELTAVLEAGPGDGPAPGVPESGVTDTAADLPLDDDALDALLAETLAANPDLAAFEGVDGRTLYHAPALLSRTYAAILDRKGSPLALMAHTIRDNSARYPRPVPVGLFEHPPFGLTSDQIAQALKDMAASPEFADIACTVASNGVAYLFSSRHLEPAYAAFLAEHAEVGLAESP